MNEEHKISLSKDEIPEDLNDMLTRLSKLAEMGATEFEATNTSTNKRLKVTLKLEDIK